MGACYIFVIVIFIRTVVIQAQLPWLPMEVVSWISNEHTLLDWAVKALAVLLITTPTPTDNSHLALLLYRTMKLM